MIDPGPLACYVGFTEEEVKELCKQYNMDMEEVKSWYDGYSFEKALSIYSPRSVVNCMRLGKIGNYWNQTETFEAQQIYIDMNFEGLKDDVLTLLIHLGYVAYDYDNKTVHIPNNEVRAEYVNSVSASDWGEVSRALKNSADTLEAIWQIKRNEYFRSLEEYRGNLLLVGVNYDRKTKEHECMIEEIVE